MSLSKEQQQQVIKHLQGFICSAQFELDGHRVDVCRERKNERETALVVYIDDQVKGVNLSTIDDKTEEVAKKVYRHRTRACYSQKHIKEIEKIWGKRRAKKEFLRLYEKTTYLDCSFNTAATLVRQFSKLDGLKLVKLGGKPV